MRMLARIVPSAVLLAALGFAVGRLSHRSGPATPPALVHRASGGAFTVSYPAAWRSQPAARGAIAGAVTLVPAQPRSAQLLIGVTHPTRPAGLTARLRASLAHVPVPQLVLLGGSTFDRYLDARARTGAASEAIYTLPTTAGTITGVCSAPEATATLTAACEQVLGSLRLTSGRILSLTVSPAYAFQLNRILSQLNAVRAAAGPGLRSTNPRTIAAAASRLSVADARAAAATRHITGPGISVANESLAEALDRGARAYGGLTGAATALDSAGYARAEASIARASAQLEAAYAQLRRLGYRIS